MGEAKKPSTSDTVRRFLPSIQSIQTHYTFVIAIIVIVAFLYFYGVVLSSGGSGVNAFEGIEKVSATLGPIVAAIIGYYFGQRPVQQLAEQARNAANERDDIKKDLESVSRIAEKYEDKLRSLAK
jgi:hypothetical protein